MQKLLFILLFTATTLWGQDVVRLSFEPEGGIKAGPVQLKLLSGETARIYYTTDGSEPTSGSKLYKEPISVSGVKVVRAVAYENGRRSKVVTQSYFCDRNYSLPVVSLTTNPDNLWDSLTGIYVKGCCADTIEPYMGANYWKSWEKRANVEMYLPDGKKCFNQEVGISIFGGYSRWLPQKSIAVIARPQYGSKRIDYPIFPERDIKKYKSFVIRNAGGDFQRAHLRDAFMTQLAKPTGLAIQAYRPVVFYLNGEYWGIQNLREKINEHYLNANFGVDKDNVDILRHNAVARHGSSRNYKKLLAYLRNNDMSNDRVIDSLRKFMDVDDYIRYNIAEVYSDNRDAGGNIRYWREQNDSAKWRWVFYDLDLGLGNNEPKGYKRNTLEKFTSENNEKWPDPPWSTFIIRSLLANEKLRVQYINTFADHLNTVYHPDTARELLHRMSDVIDEEMRFHVKRWETSYKNWKHHVGIVDHFVRVRPYWCRQHLMQKFGLTDTAIVTINYPGDEVANVTFNSLDIRRNFKGVYFVGIPVKIEVKPKHDYEFVGWKDRPEKTTELEVVLSDDEVFEPMFKPKERSPFTDKIIFSEFMVCHSESDTSEDWVELYNRSKETIDLAHWGLTKSSYRKRFVLSQKLQIPPGTFVIIAQNRLRYGSAFNTDTVVVTGDFGFGLSCKSEHLVLYDDEGLIVDSLTYFHEGKGGDSLFSYSLTHPDSSRSSPSAWRMEKPSPGSLSFGYKDFVREEEKKAYWTEILYIGGGGFFFILASGLFFYRYYKRKHRLNR